jgi:hypothetical protein
MVGYSGLYEVRLAMHHMIYNMVGYSILYEVRLWYIASLTLYRIKYPTILYVIWYIISLTYYRIEYPTILYVIWYIASLCIWHTIWWGLYPVWSKTDNISYEIQYGGVLWPVWSKTSNASYDIQYGGVLGYPTILYVIWYIISLTSYRIEYPPYCMSYDILSVLLHTG